MPFLISAHGASVSRTREIGASPTAVYALVSDLPRMGKWSPEAAGGRWLGTVDPLSGPRVGQRFIGANRNSWHFWATLSRVTHADPGRRFAFRVRFGPFAVADWSYDLTPVADLSTGATRCQVTETWTDRRVGFFKLLAGPVTGTSSDRSELTRASIDATLAAIAKAAEIPSSV